MTATDLCLSNIDLCGQIAIYLDVYDLLSVEIVNSTWKLPVTRAFHELRRHEVFLYHTYKVRKDFNSDKAMVCVIENNRRQGCQGLLVLGGSFGSIHYENLLLEENRTHIVGEVLESAALNIRLGSSASTIDVNGCVISIGGWDETDEQVLNDVLSLNVQEETGWIAMQPLPAPRSFSAATTTIQGDIIVLGGGDSPFRGANTFNDCLIRRYSQDITGNGIVNGWSANILPNMNHKRCGHSVVTLLNDSVMVLGGYNGGFDYLSSVEVLDARLDRWSMLPPMSVCRSGMAAVVGPGGAVYVTGGSSDGTVSHKLCERFDPREGKRFYPVADMNVPRGYVAGCIGSRDCFFVSGGCHEFRFQEGLEWLDFRMNKWTHLLTAHNTNEGDDEDTGQFGDYLQRACHQMLYIV